MNLLSTIGDICQQLLWNGHVWLKLAFNKGHGPMSGNSVRKTKKMIEEELKVKSGNSDYTKWRRQIFDDMTPEEFDAAIKDFAESRRKDRIIDRSF